MIAICSWHVCNVRSRIGSTRWQRVAQTDTLADAGTSTAPDYALMTLAGTSFVSV